MPDGLTRGFPGDPGEGEPTVLFELTNLMRKDVAKTAADFQSYIDK